MSLALPHNITELKQMLLDLIEKFKTLEVISKSQESKNKEQAIQIEEKDALIDSLREELRSFK